MGRQADEDDRFGVETLGLVDGGVADALIHGDRILSHYQLGGGKRLYLITEADRAVTTALLPEEY